MLLRLDISAFLASRVFIYATVERYNSFPVVSSMRTAELVPGGYHQHQYSFCLILICHRIIFLRVLYRIQRELAEISLDPPPNCR